MAQARSARETPAGARVSQAGAAEPPFPVPARPLRWSGRLTWFEPRGSLDSDVVRLDLEPAADGGGEEAVVGVVVFLGCYVLGILVQVPFMATDPASSSLAPGTSTS